MFVKLNINLASHQSIKFRLLSLLNQNVINCGMKTWAVETLRLMKHRSRNFDAIYHKKRRRSEWQEWNYNSELYAFSQRLKEDFDLEKLKIAFTHESFLKEEEKRQKELKISNVSFDLSSNQEYAQKGHSIIKVFAHLYLRYFLPCVPEECIKAVTKYLLSNKVLDTIGRSIGTTQLILSSEIVPKDDVVAMTVKSLVAILDETKGTNHTRKFIIDFIMTFLNDKDIFSLWDLQEPEIVLQKILHNDNLPPYEPRLLRETGKNTIFACYNVGLYVDQELIGFGPGETIKIATEMAAYDALRRIFHLTPSLMIFKYGQPAYNIDYNQMNEKHFSLSEYKQSDLRKKKKRQNVQSLI